MKSFIDGIAGLRQRNVAGPVPYASPRALGGLFGGGQRSTRTVQLNAYGSVGTLFAIVNRLAHMTAKSDWHLYREQVDGRRVTLPGVPPARTEITSHAALNLWNKPNAFMTRQTFIESVQQHIDLVGEGWILVTRDPRVNFPTGLWPVRPDRMEPVPSTTSYLAGYIYHGPEGEQIPLNVDDILFIRQPNPLDPYRGMGPVQAILADLDASRYHAEWNRNFFLNSAQPGGVIEVDRALDDAEFDRMVERWREQHQGVAQAHRVAVLEQGKWVDVKYTMADMQFTELRNVSRDIIREAFAYPKSMLGDAQDVNKANAITGSEDFARWMIDPRLHRFQTTLNSFYLPMFGPTGDRRFFGYDDPVPQNRQADDAERLSKAQSAQYLVSAGYDPAAVAEAVGLPPMATVPPPSPAPGAPAAGSSPEGPPGSHPAAG